MDTLGLLLGAIVHPASVQDRDGLAPLLARIRRRFPWLRLLFADGGYQGDLAAVAAREERLVLAIVKRSDQAKGFVVCRAAGWWNAPSPGSAATGGWPGKSRP